MVSGAEVTLAVQTRQQLTGHTVMSEGVECRLRRWSCTLLDGRPRALNAAQLPYIKKVEFILHPTFDNPHRVVHHPPFKIEEDGWGEFDLVIIVHFIDCHEPHRIFHDLNFRSESYQEVYPFIVPNPGVAFLALFNKQNTVSRKTVPARATKARKGLPRDSHYSASQRTSNDSSSSISDLDSDSDLTSSGEESDAPSAAGKRRSASSASVASSGRGQRLPRPRDEARLSAAHKHGADKAMRPKSATGRAAAGDNPMSSPLSAADDHRVRPAGPKPAARQRKDAALSATRRMANDAPAAAKARRSPSDGVLRSPAALPGTSLAQKTVRPAALPRGTARSPTRTPAVPQQPVRAADRKLAAVPARNSNSASPPASRLDRPVAPGSTGIRRQPPQDQQRRRRASDVLETPAKGGARRRTAGPEVSQAPIKASPPLNAARLEVTAVKRVPAPGITGLKVPKKRTIKAAAADDLGDVGRRIKPEKRDIAGRDDPVAAKRPRMSGAGAVRGGDDQRFSSLSPASTSTSSSKSPPQPRALAPAAGTAASSRAAFVREREKQRYLDPARDPAAKTAPAPARMQKSPAAALGLLSKNARSNIAAAAARARVATDEPEELAAEPPRRKIAKRDIADISVPKISHKPTPAAGMAAAADAAPAPLGVEDDRPRAAAVPARFKRTVSAEKRGAVPDDSMAAGLALAPELSRKMERIMERAALLNEQSMVGFLRLLHSLRVEQEPESADVITEEATEQVESNGMYSCNLSMLAPEAIDRLWVFMREICV